MLLNPFEFNAVHSCINGTCKPPELMLGRPKWIC